MQSETLQNIRKREEVFPQEFKKVAGYKDLSQKTRNPRATPVCPSRQVLKQVSI